MPFDFLKPKTNKTVHKYPTDFLLGDLLVKAGVISDAKLEEAVKLAGNKHLHVGQMLIMAGYISPRDLQAAVDAQSLLRDRAIDSAMASRCLKIACKTGVSFAEVVRDQDQANTSSNSTNRLGEILLEAGLIDGDQFGKAMQRSMSTGLPLGRILVLNGALQESVLTLALELQVRIRDGMSSRHEAVQALAQAAGVDPVSQEQTMSLEGMGLTRPPRRKGLRLGELMVLAGLLAETDVMNCVELGLVNQCPIGQMMVEQGYITPEILDAALELQKQIDEEKLQPMEAAEILSKIRNSGQEVGSAIEEHNQGKPEEAKQNVGFEKLLLLARVVTEDDIESALQQAATSPQVLSRVLNLTGYIDELTMQAILQAYTMMTNGFLSQDDTIIALDYCLHKPAETRATFGQALSELGWNAMVPLQMQSAHSVDISQVRLAAMQAPDQKASAQEYAESTLGALAEIESAAKEANEATAEETNGQTDSSEFWGIGAQSEESSLTATSEDAAGEEQQFEADPASELAELDMAAAQSAMILEQDTPEQVAEAVEEALEDAAQHEQAVIELKEAAAAIESELAQENATAEAVLEAIEEEIETEEAAAVSSIDSASILAAELAKMAGTEAILSQLQAEHGTKSKSEKEPLVSAASILEPEAVESAPEKSAADSLIAEVQSKLASAEPVAASAAASLLADLEGASAGFTAPAAEPAPDQAKSDAAAANELLAQLEASNRETAEHAVIPESKKAEPASEVVAEPTNGSGGKRDDLADLFSSALSELAGTKDKGSDSSANDVKDAEVAKEQKEPAKDAKDTKDSKDSKDAKDSQRAVPRKNDALASDSGQHADTFSASDEDSLRYLFSERLTEPDSTAAEVLASKEPSGDIASAAAADQAARTAQELMEELLSRAAADESSKKDEQSRADAEARAQREAEEKLKREAELLEAEARRKAEAEIALKEKEEKAKREAEAQARKDAEEQARKESEERAKRDAEELQRRVESAKKEALELREADARKKQEAEETMRRQAEDLKRQDAEEQEKKIALAKEAAAAKAAAAAAAAKAAEVPAAVASAAEAAPDTTKKADFWGAVVPPTKPTPAEISAIEATSELTALGANAVTAKSTTASQGGAAGGAKAIPASAAESTAKAQSTPAAATTAAASGTGTGAKPPASAEPVAKAKPSAEAAPKPAEAVAQSNTVSPAASAPKSEAAAVAEGADSKLTNAKNAELLAAATKAIKAVENAEPGSAAKEELKGSLITSLSRLAESYYEQGDYSEAQGLYERILMLRQSQLGPKHPSLGADLTNLAGVLCVQGKFSQAESFVKRVVGIVEDTEPLDHMKLADSISTLAGILFQQGKYQDCEPFLERALKVKQEKLGAEHPEVADNLRDYAKLLKKLGRDADAERVYMQAKAILAKRPKQPVA